MAGDEDDDSPMVRMLDALPQDMRQALEQSLRQAMQEGIPAPMQVLMGEDQSQNTLQRLTGLREQLEKQEQTQQTPITVRHYHCDHLGTPLALTDQNQQIVWAARLDPWGNIEQEFNPHDIDQAIRLPGQHHDKDTGLYYNRHRYYDPSIGSYVNQDPIGLRGGENFYKYPINPNRLIDPLGLQQTINPLASFFEDWIAAPRRDGKPLGYGCGDAKTDNIVPDKPLGYDFLPACRGHDLCYGDKSGPSKAKCDDDFINDMLKECDKYIDDAPVSHGGKGLQRSECSGVAAIYYKAVKEKGQAAFNAARK